MFKYYYDPVTGQFKYANSNPKVLYDLPYIEKDSSFFYSDYRVDVTTGELIYEPKPRNPRG